MNAIPEEVVGIASLLLGEQRLQPSRLCIRLAGHDVAVRSNSAAFMQRMHAYFSHVRIPDCDDVQDVVIAIDRDIIDTGLAFVDWKREPGKRGRKDAIHDFAGGRLVHKLRTGMVFLQSGHTLVAAGPCLECNNQVINFINSQFLNRLQNQGYALCHASALTRNGTGLAIAGLSGGGKSTLMLDLMEDDATGYVTNDRLLVKRQGDETRAIGIPKLPRINPGTIVHNPRLFPLIDAAERERLLQLDRDELWHLEQKYDVDIEELYGRGRIRHESGLHRFLVLNWRHGAGQPLRVEPADLRQRPHLLGAIMKPPGPFYVDAEGAFNRDDEHPDAGAYLDALANVEVFEARGDIDFERLGVICLHELMG